MCVAYIFCSNLKKIIDIKNPRDLVGPPLSLSHTHTHTHTHTHNTHIQFFILSHLFKFHNAYIRIKKKSWKLLADRGPKTPQGTV